jgi:signal transduction histidine kinase
MSARARVITAESLHERLDVKQRDDELGDLARTFDGLLSRLQSAFESQRRFVANASHELRTPVTLERALIEVALADPDASAESLRACCERVLAAGERQEQLIEALLTLARTQGGVEARDPVDLAEVAGALVEQTGADTGGIELRGTLDDAPTQGDAALIERLIANLLENAIAHNEPGGWVELSTAIAKGEAESQGEAILRVSNSGPIVPAERVAELFEPFRRLSGERTNGRGGLGLGLSIVRAIADAHDATLTVTPRPEGGLDVEVRFAAASTHLG